MNLMARLVTLSDPPNSRGWGEERQPSQLGSRENKKKLGKIIQVAPNSLNCKSERKYNAIALELKPVLMRGGEEKYSIR